MPDDRDDFDRIVEGLDLDLAGLEDLDAAAANAAAERERRDAAAEAEAVAPPEDESDDDAFYRQVGPAHPGTDRRTVALWAALAAGPLLLLLAAFTSVRVPGAVLVTLTLVSVAAVIWLIVRLPDHGPSQRDWPDDGAEL